MTFWQCIKVIFLEWWDRPIRDRAYAICLANIERLERELFPEWFPPRSKREFEREVFFGPGAVWEVEDANMIQVLSSHGLVGSADAQKMLQRAQAMQ